MFVGARRWWWLGGAATVVAVVALVWALWPSPDVEPRARQYRDVTACLLTDGQGVVGAQAAAVWAGMREASLHTDGQVRYLAVAGAQTVENARSFVGTLVLGRCAVIVAVGDVPVAAVRSLATQYPQQRFLIVHKSDVSDVSDVSNISVVSPSSAETVRAAVTGAVTPFLSTP